MGLINRIRTWYWKPKIKHWFKTWTVPAMESAGSMPSKFQEFIMRTQMLYILFYRHKFTLDTPGVEFTLKNWIALRGELFNDY